MKTIRLKRPFLSHGQQVTELTIREPTAGECLRIGDLGDFHARNEVYIENQAAITAYAEVTIMHELGGRAVLSLLGVADAIQIREAIYGFFRDARQAASETA
jgi:hypothetical protein